MTPDERVFQTLSGVCRGTYLAYKPGKAPPLPWFVYSRRRGEEFFADNDNYARLPRYTVELLLEESDPELVERFEQALSSLGTWRMYGADMLEGEGCIQHTYQLQYIHNRTSQPPHG